MSITINGSTGVAGNNGTAGTPTYQGEDTNTGIFFPAADTIAFAEGGSEVARFDSSGNLLVGTTSQYGSQKLSLNGGIAIDGRSAVTPGLSEKGDDNTGVFWPAADALGFSTGGSERMRIDSSGNVGIGTTSPLSLSGYTVQTINNATSGAITYYQQNNTTVGRVVATSSDFYVGGVKAGSNLILESAGAERARIASGGSFSVSSNGGVNPGVIIEPAGSVLMGNSAAASGHFFSAFYRSLITIGSITQNGTTGVSYNTSSDYRLKENVAPMQNALDTVAQLNPVTYTWKADGSAGQGFIAHELQAVVPDCVTGEKDAVDETGNPQYQGVDTSFLVATLVAAIKEQQALITAFETRLAALEAQ